MGFVDCVKFLCKALWFVIACFVTFFAILNLTSGTMGYLAMSTENGQCVYEPAVCISYEAETCETKNRMTTCKTVTRWKPDLKSTVFEGGDQSGRRLQNNTIENSAITTTAPSVITVVSDSTQAPSRVRVTGTQRPDRAPGTGLIRRSTTTMASESNASTTIAPPPPPPVIFGRPGNSNTIDSNTTAPVGGSACELNDVNEVANFWSKHALTDIKLWNRFARLSKFNVADMLEMLKGFPSSEPPFATTQEACTAMIPNMSASPQPCVRFKSKLDASALCADDKTGMMKDEVTTQASSRLMFGCIGIAISIGAWCLMRSDTKRSGTAVKPVDDSNFSAIPKMGTSEEKAALTTGEAVGAAPAQSGGVLKACCRCSR